MPAGDHKQPRFVALATLFVAPAVNQFLCTSDCAAAAGCARRPQQPPQLHRRRREGPHGALVCLEATTNVEDICAKICGRKVVRAESSAARSASRALLNMYVLGLQRAKQRLFRGPGALVATCYKFQAVLTTFKFFPFRTSQTIRMCSARERKLGARRRARALDLAPRARARPRAAVSSRILGGSDLRAV